MRVAWSALPLLPASLCIASLLVSPARVDHDSAMFLQSAELLLEGRRPYVDLVELNPPLASYLSVVPVLLARATGLDPLRMLQWLAFTLAAGSAFALRAQIVRLRPEALAWASLTATASLLFVCSVWAANLLPQRDMLVALALAPYAAARWSAWSGRPLPAAAGLLAGFAAGLVLCLKPHYIAAAIALEAYFALGHRGKRAGWLEVGALLTTLALYAAHFLFWPVEARDDYFNRWLPLIARGYSAYDVPLASMFGGRMLVRLSACACILVVRPFWRGLLPDLSGAFAALGVVTTGTYLLQHKGWVYHLLPARAFTALAVAGVVSAVVERLRGGGVGGRRDAGWALVAWLGTAAAATTWPLLPAPAMLPSPFAPWVERYSRPGEGVAVLSTSVPEAHPLLFVLGRRPATRFLWLFPAALFAARSAPPDPGRTAALEEDERLFLQEVRADLERNRPSVIIVHAAGHCQACPPGFSLRAYLGRARVLDLLREYRRVATVDGYEVWVAAERAP